MRGKLGRFVVRYDLPEGGGIAWEPEPGEEDAGHFDLFGDRELLKQFLVPDFRLTVDLAGRVETEERP